MNFSRNKGRFEEGKHFFRLEGDKLKEFVTHLKLVTNQNEEIESDLKGLANPNMIRSLTLWTERGAARHAKMLDTDQAWNMFDKLEEAYFNNVTPEPTDYINWRTHAEIKKIITAIASRFSYSGSWSFGIHHRLRKITGSKSPHPFETKHLPLIANELIQVIAIANATRDFTHDFETKVLKALVRDAKEVEEIEKLIKETESKQQALLSDAFNDFLFKYQNKIPRHELESMNNLIAREKAYASQENSEKTPG